MYRGVVPGADELKSSAHAVRHPNVGVAQHGQGSRFPEDVGAAQTEVRRHGGSHRELWTLYAGPRQ